MATINSVLGPLDTARMGFTLAHEHVVVSSAGLPHVFPEIVHPQAQDWAVEELSAARAGGLGTIVDVSTFDLGRDVRLLREVSSASGVQIVCATGTWRDIPRSFWRAPVDGIARLFVREIETGIEGTGIKAGIIKVANDAEGVTPEGEIILRAAARAQRETGVPISTHTWAPARVGDAQVRIFEEEGVDPGRVYVGHSNDTTDLDYLLGLLRKGVWLGLDRFPGQRTESTPDWVGRTQTTYRLIEAGFAHRLLLGHDYSVARPFDTAGQRAARGERNPDGYRFIARNVLPRLRELGVREETIDQLMVENPRRFFEG
jgi:phosphotriesterase-related protein